MRGARSYPNPWPIPDPGTITPYPNGFFHDHIPASPTLDPNSASLSAKFVSGYENNYGTVGIDIYAQGGGIYVVDSSVTPFIPVIVQRTSTSTAYTVEVPIPWLIRGASQSGSDNSLFIVDTVTRKAWELWEYQVHGTVASCKSFAYADIDTGSGAADRGALNSSANTCSASGLMYSGGIVRVLELQAGTIDHALMMGFPGIDGYVSPATTSDDLGEGDSWALPYGTHFFFPSSVNLANYNLSPFAYTIARAIQNYGFFICDFSGNASVSCEGGYGWQMATGVNPYTALLNGVASYEALNNVPWNLLAVQAHS